MKNKKIAAVVFGIVMLFVMNVHTTHASDFFKPGTTIDLNKIVANAKKILDSNPAFVKKFEPSSVGGHPGNQIRATCSLADIASGKVLPASCGQPSSVTVDPAFTADDNTDSDIFGYNVFNTIQAGIDGVNDSGTVRVKAGTYTEHITISRDIDVQPYDSFDGEWVGAPEGSPHLIAPDCTAVTITSASFSGIEGFEIDGNDSAHTCTDPIVDITGGEEMILIMDTFEHAALAINVNDSTFSLGFLSRFLDIGTAVHVDTVDNILFWPLFYWGSASGPHSAIANPSGTGPGITGAGAGQVIFRSFLTEFPITDGNFFSTTTIDGRNIQQLFFNGDTFFPLADFGLGSLTDIPSINVQEPTTVTLPTSGGTSSVFMDGIPIVFSPGYLLAPPSEDNFDGTQFSASMIAGNRAKNIPDGKKVAGEVLQFGVPGLELDINNEGADSATVNIFVGKRYNGKTLDIYRSTSLTDGWTQDMLIDTTCTVSDGLCSFDTSAFSYFAATTDHLLASSSSSVGGSIFSNPSAFLQNQQQPSIAPVSTPAPTTSPVSPFITNLKKGSIGDAVKKLQEFLNKNGFAAGLADGMFGNHTLAAIKNFQAAHNLTADGIIGPHTLQVLNTLFVQ